MEPLRRVNRFHLPFRKTTGCFAEHRLRAEELRCGWEVVARRDKTRVVAIEIVRCSTDFWSNSGGIVHRTY